MKNIPSATPQHRLYDIVSVMGGQRAHEPVARIAALDQVSALKTYGLNPEAFKRYNSGEIVPGLSLAAYESHPSLQQGPFNLSEGAIIYVRAASLDEALQLLDRVNDGFVEDSRGWVVASRPLQA